MFLSHLSHLLNFRSTSVAGVQGRKYWLMKKISISAVYISLSIATRAILAGALQGRFCPFREETCNSERYGNLNSAVPKVTPSYVRLVTSLVVQYIDLLSMKLIHVTNASPRQFQPSPNKGPNKRTFAAHSDLIRQICFENSRQPFRGRSRSTERLVPFVPPTQLTLSVKNKTTSPTTWTDS